MIDWLIVAAFGPELAPLGVPLGEATLGRARIFTATLGVGPIAAAAAAGALLERVTARRVAFVGTAGVFAPAREKHPIGSAVVARSTSLVDASVLRGLAERPDAQEDDFSLDARDAGEDAARVATTSAITVDDALARAIADAGFDLEHLELAGVAAACAARDLALSAVLGVSNIVGADGRAEWLAHHAQASAAAVARLRVWLDD